MARAKPESHARESAVSLSPSDDGASRPPSSDELLLAYASLRDLLERERASNDDLRRRLQQTYVGTIEMLADAVETKDAYTHGHCRRVSHYARLVARRMELPDREVKLACLAALLHDVGKIGVTDAVLNKPGRLLPEEKLLIQSHVRLGHDLLESVPGLREVAGAVLYHHEWYDGTGYPDGLSGDDIPRVARIVGVVDAFCAMIDTRSYKPARTPDEAREELRRCAGTQFDPNVVEAALDVLPAPIDLGDDDLEYACGLLFE
jgi:putative nucleotidyltransferase with HDIG domain